MFIFSASKIVSLIPEIEEYEQDDFINNNTIFDNYNQESKRIKELNKLTKHLTNYKRREVFLLIAKILHNADNLFTLMKATIDKILDGKEKLQEYVRSANAS